MGDVWGDNSSHVSSSQRQRQPIDLDLKRISKVTSLRSIEKKDRNKTFPEQMKKAALNLQKQNKKQQQFGKQKEKPVEVGKDPDNGKFFLHVNPSDIENLSQEDMQQLSK